MTQEKAKKQGFVSLSGVCFKILLYILLFLYSSFYDINVIKK